MVENTSELSSRGLSRLSGPLLFIIYFNDLVVLEDNCCLVIVYADDNNYAVWNGADRQANQVRINSKLVEVEI